MLLPDVNVLVYAHRRDAIEHPRYAAWLVAVATGPEPFACSELALSGFVRIVTNPKIFRNPSSLGEALNFADELRKRPTCMPLRPGPRHWSLFEQLCTQTNAQGPFVADAYHAALAIEHGCELVTTDGDFSRFPGLRWHHPLRA